ncbi:MAG TPA: TetR family transcriptional regulator [Acidimicrobiales bacterium]|nr:TetR family transcriptional regulator [Acidimicrobiales bacterium]
MASDPAPLADDDLVAPGGRRLGRRAQETRRKLLDATAELLESRPLLDLTVVEIARRVGTSPASFYQYFPNVHDAVLALVDEAGGEILSLVPLVERPWKGAAGFEACKELVARYVEYWDERRAVLRVRDLAAAEGDQRFRAARNESMSIITDRLRDKIAEAQRAGAVSSSLTPYAAASAMMAMMGRMAAYHRELEARGLSEDDLVETVARIVFQTVTGRRR